MIGTERDQGVGSATALIGLSIAMLSGISISGSECSSCHVDTTALTIGLGAGIPVMLGGLVLVATHRGWAVSQTPVATRHDWTISQSPSAFDAQGARFDASPRAVSIAGARGVERPILTVPILTGCF